MKGLPSLDCLEAQSCDDARSVNLSSAKVPPCLLLVLSNKILCRLYGTNQRASLTNVSTHCVTYHFPLHLGLIGKGGSWTSVNGLLIGQREPKEVESTKPIPQARTGGVPWTLARPAAVKGMMGPQPDCPINCNQGILPAKAPQEL